MNTARRARKEEVSFLVGTFHPCDILDPRTGGKNFVFEKCISNILEELCSLEEVNVNFITLSSMVKKIENTLPQTTSLMPEEV